MADMLGKASRWLEGQRHKYLTRAVVYRRGLESITVNASIGRSSFEQSDESGLITRMESIDFLIRSSDLVINGIRTLPMPGDQIRDQLDINVFVYEVMADGADAEYKWSDPNKETLRIHTKLVATD